MRLRKYRADELLFVVNMARQLGGMTHGSAHEDANESMLFARELTYVSTEILKKDLPDITWRSLVPIKPGPSNADEAFAYREQVNAGEAKLISDYAADLPNVAASRTETAQLIKPYGAAYTYSLQDLRACQQNGTNLDIEYAEIAKEAIEQRLEKAALRGEPEANFEGLAGISGITETTASAAPGTLTAAQWAADLNAAYQGLHTDTNGVFMNRQLTFACATEEYVSLTQLRDLGNGNWGTFADVLKTKCPWLGEIVHSVRLKDVATGGTKNRNILYVKDPKVLHCVLPVDFEQQLPQVRNMAFVTNCMSRFGGLVVRHKKAIRYIKEA